MVHMMVRVTVDDYAMFREAYDNAEKIRRSAGSTGNTVYRSVEDDNEVTVRIEFPTADAAKAYSTSQELRDCMQEVGIQAPPVVWFVNEV